MIDLDELIAYAQRWIVLHRENKYQREAAKIMHRVVDALKSVRAERDAALAAIERVRELHRKETRRSGWEVCTHCEVGALQDPVDWPCDTIAALATGKENTDDG